MTHAIPRLRSTARRPTVVVASLFAFSLCLGFAADAPAAAPVRVAPGVYLQRLDLGRQLALGVARRAPGAATRTARRASSAAARLRSANGRGRRRSPSIPRRFPGSSLQRQFCGGSLVAPTLVITAAHCMFDFDHNTFTNATRYAAVTGRTTLSSSDGQEIPFASYQFFTDASGNPLFNPVTFDFDVVLVRLASPSSASPILLAGPDEAATWERGRDAYVTGWGSTSEGGGRSDQLRAARIGIIGDSTCGAGNSYGGDFHPTFMVCAGLMAGGVDTCQGDSGGPLVVPLAGGGYRLVGDTSFGVGCATPFFPGIYGRIAADPMRSALGERRDRCRGREHRRLRRRARPAVGAGDPVRRRPAEEDLEEEGALRVLLEQGRGNLHLQARQEARRPRATPRSASRRSRRASTVSR